MKKYEVSDAFINSLEKKLDGINPPKIPEAKPVEIAEAAPDKKENNTVKTGMFAALKNKFKKQPFDVTKLKTGDIAPDGSIYLGLYNDKDWFVTAKDAKDYTGDRLRMSFNAAADYAKRINSHGHNDWIIPPCHDDLKEPNILKALYNNKDTGAFRNTYSDSYSGQWYWSSTNCPYDDTRAGQVSLDHKGAIWWNKNNEVYVRPVRSQPREKLKAA